MTVSLIDTFTDQVFVGLMDYLKTKRVPGTWKEGCGETSCQGLVGMDLYCG